MYLYHWIQKLGFDEFILQNPLLNIQACILKNIKINCRNIYNIGKLEEWKKLEKQNTSKIVKNRKRPNVYQKIVMFEYSTFKQSDISQI